MNDSLKRTLFAIFVGFGICGYIVQVGRMFVSTYTSYNKSIIIEMVKSECIK